jgi:hypothetical protein
LPVDWPSLKEAFDGFDLYVMIGYRRLVDWYPSARRQVMFRSKKWGGRNFRPFFPNYSRLSRRHTHNTYFTPKELYQQVRTKTRGILRDDQIKLLNVYEYDTVSENVLCSLIPNAPTACKALMRDLAVEQESIHMGNGDNVDVTTYMEVMKVAGSTGLVNPSRIGYSKAVGKMRKYNEQTLGRGARDLPLICPGNDTLNDFLEASLMAEAELFPAFASSERGESSHRDKFWADVQKKKYCDVNVTSVLDDPQWQEFLSTLR